MLKFFEVFLYVKKALKTIWQSIINKLTKILTGAVVLNEPDIQKKISQITVNPYGAMTIFFRDQKSVTLRYSEVYRTVKALQSLEKISPSLVKEIHLNYPELFKTPQPTEEELSELFFTCAESLKKEMALARKKGLKLLLALGEDHSALPSLLLQAMFLQAANEHDIQHFFVESNAKKIREILNRDPEAHEMENIWFVIPYAQFELKMSVVPLDVNSERYDSKNWDHIISSRENNFEKAILNVNEHSILVVGAAHLELFSKSESLKNKYHIAMFNITNYSNEMIRSLLEGRHNGLLGKIMSLVMRKALARFNFAFTSEKVTKISISGNLEGFSPHKILALPKQLNLEKNLKSPSKSIAENDNDNNVVSLEFSASKVQKNRNSHSSHQGLLTDEINTKKMLRF